MGSAWEMRGGQLLVPLMAGELVRAAAEISQVLRRCPVAWAPQRCPETLELAQSPNWEPLGSNIYFHPQSFLWVPGVPASGLSKLPSSSLILNSCLQISSLGKPMKTIGIEMCAIALSVAVIKYPWEKKERERSIWLKTPS